MSFKTKIYRILEPLDADMMSTASSKSSLFYLE